MLPHEKALVKRLENEPLALIGVDTDPDREAFQRSCRKQGITWRNSFQGGVTGPLCRAWSVYRFPTLYVLDARGVVRYMDVTGAALDRAVDQLLVEARAARPNR